MALQDWALRAKSFTLFVVSFLCLLLSLQYVSHQLTTPAIMHSHFHIYRPRWTLTLWNRKTRKTLSSTRCFDRGVVKAAGN